MQAKHEQVEQEATDERTKVEAYFPSTIFEDIKAEQPHLFNSTAVVEKDFVRTEVVAGEEILLNIASEEVRAAFEEINASKIERPTSLTYRWLVPMASDVGRIATLTTNQLCIWNDAPLAAGGVPRGFVTQAGSEYLVGGGAWLNPDSGWMSSLRDASLTAQELQQRCPKVPNFVVEVRSRSETATNQKSKMVQWIRAGVQSGFLIDPIGRKTYVYARGIPAGGGHASSCPLLGANLGAALPAGVSRVPSTGGRVWVKQYAWGANAAVGQGPALVVPGVGHLAGFNLDHRRFRT